MILLDLFLSFLKIGAVSFGGGYGMIPLIRETVLEKAWLSEEQFLDFIAVSESTPGPIAVNIATFVGSSQAGFFGSLLATFGVVLPAFLVLLAISLLLRRLLEYAGVKAFLGGVRPVVVGLILSTALTLSIAALFGFSTVGDPFAPDISAVIIFAVLILVSILYKRFRKKKASPILLILLSAILGLFL